MLNTKETVAGWVAGSARRSSGSSTSTAPNAARMVNNLDWTGADVGAGLPPRRRQALPGEPDAGPRRGRNRLEDGISYTEFSYVLLQSLDYLELFRELRLHAAVRWQRPVGQHHRRRGAGAAVRGAQVHALATPLLTKADGTKFGKTEAGTVWLDPAMTSPYAFHQFFLNAEDAKVVEYLKVFSERAGERDRGAGAADRRGSRICARRSGRWPTT